MNTGMACVHGQAVLGPSPLPREHAAMPPLGNVSDLCTAAPS